MSLRIAISAGEVSGDRHLARAVAALKKAYPGCEIRGMAGKECQEAGAELVVDCYRSGATMGFAEIVRSLGKILSSFKTMSNLIREWRPDVVVLCDYPDFNMRLAKVAHTAGCKVVYFIPPKAWAWRPGRVELIKRYVDHVAAIFPFEKAFYAERGYHHVTYIGNPLGDRVTGEERERTNTLLMLPGSRAFEVKLILPPMLRVFERLRSQRPGLLGRVVVAPNMDPKELTATAATIVSQDTVGALSWAQGDALEEMRSARAGILKSGTCNVEGAVAGLPFVSVYSGSWVSKVITSLLVKLKEYSPVNIMRPGTAKEVFGVTIDEDALERETAKILDDGAEREKMRAALAEVQVLLKSFDLPAGMTTSSSAGERVAHVVVSVAKGDVVAGTSEQRGAESG
jgi:lipid-A-disaccharide synthase